MTDNFQTNLSGQFTPVPNPSKVVLRGRGPMFDYLKHELEAINRPDLKKTIVEIRRI